MLLNDAGYVSFPDKKYHFYIKDHQGNVRVVADAEGNVEEVNDYYPFGGLMSNATGNDFQKYKYNGKELDRKAGLNLYDYGARFYDPGIGRWHVVDPMSEKYDTWTPYVYCADNPLKFIDPNGKDWLTKADEEYAEKLAKEMDKKIDSKQKSIDRINKKIDRKLSKGKNVDDERKKVNDTQAIIDNLKAGISELNEMGETSDQTFTYKQISGDVGYTGMDAKGLIVMEVTSVENGIHESSHGYDIWKEGAYNKDSLLKGEIKAYSRQYSFNPMSVPVSYFGRANSISNINERWILGLKSTTGNYLYIEKLYPDKNIKDILDLIK